MQIALMVAIVICIIAYTLAHGIYMDRQPFVYSNDKVLEGSFIVALMSFAATTAFTMVYNIMFI